MHHRPLRSRVDAPKLRPTFTVDLPLAADEAASVLRARLKASEHADCGMSAGRCAELFVPEDERRLWSPCLSVQLEDVGDHALLRGRYAPHPEVWTLFMFIYFGVVFATLIGTVWGYVQWTLGESPWGLWALPLGIPVLVGLHLAAAFGQRRGHDQMRGLRGRLDELLEGLRTTEGPTT